MSKQRTSGILDLVAVPVLIIVVGTWLLLQLRKSVHPTDRVEATSKELEKP